MDNKSKQVLDHLNHYGKSSLSVINDKCFLFDNKLECAETLRNLRKAKYVIRDDEGYSIGPKKFDASKNDDYIEEIVVKRKTVTKKKKDKVTLPVNPKTIPDTTISVHQNTGLSIFNQLNFTGSKFHTANLEQPPNADLDKTTMTGQLAYLIFVANKPVSIKTLANIFNKKYNDVYAAIKRLCLSEHVLVVANKLKPSKKEYVFNKAFAYPFTIKSEKDKELLPERAASFIA